MDLKSNGKHVLTIREQQEVESVPYYMDGLVAQKSVQ